ncbi:MAG: molybdate ABC transporter substrate-binding protein [Steroidobacteraceae bacterium]
MKNRTALIALCVALLNLASGTGRAADQVLTIFAAASLTDVMQPIGAQFTARTKIPVRFSFASSSQLARQIESGAAADVFMSADQEWMDYLEQRKLIARSTRRDIVGNTLVLVAPTDSKVQLKIAPGFALGAALGDNGRLATGEPGSVPAGKYAKAALSRLGVWSGIKARVVGADNVRTALNFVARGDAVLGIVYGTDAKREPKVRVVDVFPATSHPRITYPAAAIATAGPAATKFVTYLAAQEAQARFKQYGFSKP